jgi:predicted membrane-bound spermidine synthase
MSETVPRPYLYLLVFTAGFTTLGVELSASRLLDPWFGNSLIVWAGLIGLILLYLAAGYWLGGRVADRAPRLPTLLRLTGLGALGIGLVPTIARPVLQVASQGMADFDAGLLVGSMAGILTLFALPVTLLGCVSPFAIRLALRDVRGSGEVAGRIYALSTAGSILGCFLPVLWLIPTIGTRRTFAVLAIALLLVVLIGYLRTGRPWDALATGVALALIALLGWRPTGPIKPAAGLLFETESAFNYIQVVDAGFERQLRLNEGEGIHSVYRPQGGPSTGSGQGLADGIWDYFLLAPAFNPVPYTPDRVRRVAIIGLAAGTMSKLFTAAYGPIPIDGAELDPAIIAVGRAWFAMNEPNLNAVAADGRWFLAQPTNLPGYQLIAVDAYRPPYIPFHLTTIEFFTLARDRLAEDGVVAVNVGRTHTDYSLVDAIAATMQQVFPSVYIVDEPDNGSPLGNSLVIATRRPTTLADLEANLPRFDHPLLVEVGRRAAPHARLAIPPPGTPIFTDDRAPVEQVVHRLVLNHMLGNK